MRNKYQQDGVGLGPLHELVVLKFKSTLKALKKDLYQEGGGECLSYFLSSTVMTFVTTTLTRLYKVG